jgi:glycosyltransferase involved in cell wall biosynthesis
LSAIVDVLLPVRDGAATITEALEDLRAQTLAAFRCLILDDGSRDATAEIAAAFSARDPRFELVRLPPRGIAVTLNEGLSRLRAPYAARFDADDRCAPDRLERQVGFLDARPDVTLVSCRIEVLGERVSAELSAYRDWLNSLLTHEQIVRDLFVESPLPHPSIIARSAPLVRLGYRDLAGPEDYDLWLRAWRDGWKFAKLDATLVGIRDHPARLTRTDPRYLPRAFLAVKAEHLVEAWRLAGEDVVVWGAGRDGVRTAKALRREGAVLRALVDIAPTKVGKRMLGVEVWPADRLREKPGCPVVVAVGVRGARAKIRLALGGWGYEEGREFVCFG